VFFDFQSAILNCNYKYSLNYIFINSKKSHIFGIKVLNALFLNPPSVVVATPLIFNIINIQLQLEIISKKLKRKIKTNCDLVDKQILSLNILSFKIF